MKATDQYFPVVLFIMLYKVVLSLSLWMKSESVTIQMKAIEQYFFMVLFVVQSLNELLRILYNTLSVH